MAEERSRADEIAGREPLGEPALHPGQHGAALGRAPAPLEELEEARGQPELEAAGSLRARDLQPLAKPPLGRVEILGRAAKAELAAHARDLGLVAVLVDAL